MRLRLLALLLVGALGVAACGAPPPDRAMSEREIRETAVQYNVLAASGRGEAACALLTEDKRDGWMNSPTVRVGRDALPSSVHDCASYWDWLGPKLPAAGRIMMLDAQVSAVAINGTDAAATYATGGTIALRWSGGHWLLA